MQIAHQIVDDETPIARYMSFEKFFHLMTFSQAFWPSLYTLRNAVGNQGDPLEGAGSQHELFRKNRFYEQLDIMMNGMLPRADGQPNEDYSSISQEIQASTFETPFGIAKCVDYISELERMISWIDVWCWNRYDHERVDMWRAYGGGSGSVMITSTVGMVKRSLKVDKGMSVAIAEVEYVEAIKGGGDLNSIYSPFSQKSHVYGAEKELRFLLYDPSADISTDRGEAGRSTKLDLRAMITEVVAHYQTPDWMMQSINEVTARAIGKEAQGSYIKKEIESSRQARSMFLKN